jgi:recombination protein RecR
LETFLRGGRSSSLVYEMWWTNLAAPLRISCCADLMLLPAPVQNLINALSRLPGIGPKTASRLTFFLLHAPDDLAQDLAEAIQALKSSTAYCQVCYNITVAGRTECEICASLERDASVICVVEEPLDVLAIERTDGFTGRYHVLHGALSPIEGIGPEDLKIRPLIARVQAGGVREVILATNPSMEGDATAMYLRQRLSPMGVHVTRLARGLPVGGDLEYADQSTLLRALAGRQEMS